MVTSAGKNIACAAKLLDAAQALKVRRVHDPNEYRVKFNASMDGVVYNLDQILVINTQSSINCLIQHKPLYILACYGTRILYTGRIGEANCGTQLQWLM